MTGRSPQLRLGVYADLRYRRDGARVSTDVAFARLLVALAERCGGLTVFGRVDPAPGVGAVELPGDLVRFVELPPYPSLRHIPDVLRALAGALPRFDAVLPQLDGIWLFGPHPMSILVARRARRRGVRVFLGVRQHFPEYLAGRSPASMRPIVVGVARGLETAFHRIARRAPTVVVGDDLARRWRGAAALLDAPFALVTEDDLVPVDTAGTQPWDDPVQLLTVSRLDPEKNPLLLADLVAELGDGWRLRVVGDGPLRDRLETRAAQLGVDDRLETAGSVPFGPRLRDEYRRSDAFVHVSHTEGVPQVLYEAMAAGLPIVATDVGGVAGALAHGECGLLVPPSDARALAHALRRLRSDPGLRRALARRGLEEVARQTLHQQAVRILAFFAEAIP